MTDRVKGFVVALAEDMRDEDAELLAKALVQLKGVLNVRAIPVDAGDFIARSRIRHEFAGKLLNVLMDGDSKP